MTDDELTDAWLAVMGRAVIHDEHLRIAYTLIRRHGRSEARRQLLIGTHRNCAAMDEADRFDADLTARWADHIAACVEGLGDAASYDDLIVRHPDLRKSDFLGVPGWKRAQV